MLSSSLWACKVYDQQLVSSSPAAAQTRPPTAALDSGAPLVLDAAPAPAANSGQPALGTPPAAADGGSPPAAMNRGPAQVPGGSTSRSTDDADAGSEAEPTASPAADGGGVADAGCATCNHGWLQQLSVDGTQVSEPLADFPVLVRLSDPSLRQHAAASGEDLHFLAQDATTPLDFEIESYGQTGELVAWVRMPSLTVGMDTTFYLGYGDGMSGRAKPSSVWADYHHVWHLAEDPSTGDAAVRDSTERAHGTARGSMSADALVPGVAGAGLQFDGQDDEISFVNDLWGSGPSTFSGWVKQRGSLGEYGTSMISLGDGATDGSARFLFSRAEDGKVKCGFFGDDDLTTAVLPLNEWKYLSWTWDGRASAVYVDAVRVLGPATHSLVATTGLFGKIGNSSFRFDYFMYGQLDELHVATSARSSAWIAAEFANQRPGSTFIKVVGDPQLAGAH